jgi:hypothetical protein
MEEIEKEGYGRNTVEKAGHGRDRESRAWIKYRAWE